MDENSETFRFDIEVPRQYIDEDGNLKPEFYEPLFNMLGKNYGGAVVNSINLSDPRELTDS